MFTLKRINIANNERGLLYKNGNLHDVLLPGRYTYFDVINTLRIEKYDVTDIEFKHRLAKFFMKAQNELLQKHLVAYELGDHEVGLSFVDGKLYDVLIPGSYTVYWREPQQLRVDVMNIAEDYELSKESVALLAYTGAEKLRNRLAGMICYAEVGENHMGLLWVNGKFERALSPGNYAFWKFNRSIQVKLLDCRVTTMEINGQEILTKDKVSLRLNLTVNYKILAPEKLALQLSNYQEFMYKEIQLVLRDAVGTKTLDELLASKGELNTGLYSNVKEKLEAFGLSIQDLGIKDIILPGEMKDILNQVVEAEKKAQANLIKRREETAATRSLLNTARMMDDNPTLLRLKELEALEKITEKVGSITVFGGMDSVMKELVTIKHRTDVAKKA